MPFRIRSCVLASGVTMTAEPALSWLKLRKHRVDRRKFFCSRECGSNLIVHATKPPHFTHARSTLDHPQPEFCKLRTGGGRRGSSSCEEIDHERHRRVLD